jgi:fructuronate reductase
MTVFDPTGQGAGIVHIGPGAFHRAHQAVFTEDAGALTGGDWGIVAIAPHSTDVIDALVAQKGSYTLVTRGAAGTRYRQIKVHAGAVAASRSPEQALAVLTRPSTRIVSLTVTEKAYRADAAIIMLLVQALAKRRDAGHLPFTLLSCDNLTDNGAVLRAVMLRATQQHDAALADWLAETGRFPSTMVDRITPAATPALLAEVRDKTGWADQIPVETEDFCQWVIEDDFVDGRPDWDKAGAIFVRDVAPYERMKLRMLNGAHSMLAYAGHLAGLKYVRDVMQNGTLAAKVAQHMDAAAATLPASDGLDTETYKSALLDRFRNPHIAHETYQIAMDGSQKMPQRVFAPALDAARSGSNLDAFALATALWARYLDGKTDEGTVYPLRDPREAELSALPQDAENRLDALFALPDLVPNELARHDGFHNTSVRALKDIIQHGVLDALQRF